MEFIELGSHGFSVGAKRIVDVRSVGESWNPEEGKLKEMKRKGKKRKEKGKLHLHDVYI